MNEECSAIDAAQRIVDLVREGCPLEALQIAVNRSTDEFSLRANIGIIESLFSIGLIYEAIAGPDQ